MEQKKESEQQRTAWQELGDAFVEVMEELGIPPLW